MAGRTHDSKAPQFGARGQWAVLERRLLVTMPLHAIISLCGEAGLLEPSRLRPLAYPTPSGYVLATPWTPTAKLPAGFQDGEATGSR
jgi:hypothetical protein